MLETYPKDVKLVIKHFPLAMHQYARKAAVAALASNKQNKFWEFHHKLFDNMASLSDAKVLEIAKELGLDMKRFNRDLNDPAIQALIERDLAEGYRAEVQGTPTIFVNGKTLKNRSLQGFMQQIGDELKKPVPTR